MRLIPFRLRLQPLLNRTNKYALFFLLLSAIATGGCVVEGADDVVGGGEVVGDAVVEDAVVAATVEVERGVDRDPKLRGGSQVIVIGETLS